MALKRIMSFPCLKPSKALIPYAMPVRTPLTSLLFTCSCFPLGPRVSLPPCNPPASLLPLLLNTPNWIQAEIFAFAVASSGMFLLLRSSLSFIPSLDRSSQTTLDKAAPSSPVTETHRPVPMFLWALTSTCHHMMASFVCMLISPLEYKLLRAGCCLLHCVFLAPGVVPRR